jgi:hypothetical protein
MNSSTSSSENDDRVSWRRWILVFASVAILASLALFGAVVVIDPFSTGRLTPITRIDFIGSRVHANAARIRVPDFDAAIFGNSHAVRIVPENLTKSSGRQFVTLAVEGTWPQEHLFLMRMFDRPRRDRAPVFVLVVDTSLCIPQKPPGRPGAALPNWLYEASTGGYLANILSPYSVRMASQRLQVMAGWARGGRADGYIFNPTINSNVALLPKLFASEQPTSAPPADAPFPYLDDVEQTIRGLSPDSIVLLVFTPVHRSQLPAAGSPAETRMAACKSRAAEVARSWPKGELIDLRVDGPKIRDRDNFYDPTHYRDSITRDIEAAIAERVRSLSSARTSGGHIGPS